MQDGWPEFTIKAHSVVPASAAHTPRQTVSGRPGQRGSRPAPVPRGLQTAAGEPLNPAQVAPPGAAAAGWSGGAAFPSSCDSRPAQRTAALHPTGRPAPPPHTHSCPARPRAGSQEGSENQADAGRSGCGTGETEAAPLLWSYQQGRAADPEAVEKGVFATNTQQSWSEGHSVGGAAQPALSHTPPSRARRPGCSPRSPSSGRMRALDATSRPCSPRQVNS